jgi:hypothetical protein
MYSDEYYPLANKNHNRSKTFTSGEITMKTMTRLITTLALSSAMIAPVLAAPVTYGVEANHTFPRFSYTHLGFSTQQSRFDKTTGSVVFDKDWAKISLAFQTRQGPFPVRILTDLMRQFREVYIEIQTFGDCSGLTAILAKEGLNLAIRRLELGTDISRLPSLFTEYSSHVACHSKPK